MPDSADLPPAMQTATVELPPDLSKWLAAWKSPIAEDPENQPLGEKIEDFLRLRMWDDQDDKDLPRPWPPAPEEEIPF